jgi:hypothetical protein
MAYADSIRTKFARMNDVATLIEGQLISINESSSIGVISTTSTTYVAYTGASITLTVNSGEKLLVLYSANVSHGTSGARIIFDLYLDGTVTGSGLGAPWVSSRSDTNGIDAVATNYLISSPAAGSHTYTLRWLTTTGTAYSFSHHMSILSLQNT